MVRRWRDGELEIPKPSSLVSWSHICLLNSIAVFETVRSYQFKKMAVRLLVHPFYKLITQRLSQATERTVCSRYTVAILLRVYEVLS